MLSWISIHGRFPVSGDAQWSQFWTQTWTFRFLGNASHKNRVIFTCLYTGTRMDFDILQLRKPILRHFFPHLTEWGLHYMCSFFSVYIYIHTKKSIDMYTSWGLPSRRNQNGPWLKASQHFLYCTSPMPSHVTSILLHCWFWEFSLKGEMPPAKIHTKRAALHINGAVHDQRSEIQKSVVMSHECNLTK